MSLVRAAAMSLFLASLVVTGCTPVTPHTSGGPIGPSVQARKPAPPPSAQEPNPAAGFEPGAILGCRRRNGESWRRRCRVRRRVRFAG